jgi:hypothetical protein
MVTDEKIYNAAWMRYRLGSVFIWLGVLVWAPFIILRIMGEQPSMSLYLPIHLLGVMGGSRLRAFARKELGIPKPQKTRLQLLGHGVIWAGILVWAPYYYLKGRWSARGCDGLSAASFDRRVWRGWIIGG